MNALLILPALLLALLPAQTPEQPPHAADSPQDFTMTAQDVADLEAATVGASAEVRDCLCKVGRLGLSNAVTGVVIGASGEILAPVIEPLDEQHAPYLLYAMDGSRTQLEQIDTQEARGLVLLRPSGTSRAPVAPLAPGASSVDMTGQHWFLIPRLAEIPLVDESHQIHAAPLSTRPAEGSRTFTVSAPGVRIGTPLFDMGARLAGIAVREKENACIFVTMKGLAREWSELDALLGEPAVRALPQLPKIPDTGDATDDDAAPVLREAWERTFLENLPELAPFGTVVNDGEPHTHSVIGAVVSADGLVVTKASDLGPRLSFSIGGESYPAVLLAEDAANDLALLLVDAPPLPALVWSDEEPVPGAWLCAPRFDGSGERLVSVGSLGAHLMDAPSIHASARVTNLGFVPEQGTDGIVVASLGSDGRAKSAGLRLNDRVTAISGAPLSTRAALAEALEELSVGDTVRVLVERDSQSLELTLETEASWPKPLPTGALTERGLGVVPSAYRGPLAAALVHDLALSSWECGGPLYGVDGRAVGLNVAAVSSGRSLALPASTVRASIDRMLTQPTNR